MILITVKDTDENIFFIGTPCYSGKIMILWFAGIQPYNIVLFCIIDSYGNLMTCHSCHRVLDLVNFRRPNSKINYRIISNHRFVHPVKRQVISGWRPERTFVNTKLIPMNRLSVHNPFILIICYLCAYAVCCKVEVIVYCICYIMINRLIPVISFFRNRIQFICYC